MRGVSKGGAHAGKRDLWITIERLVEVNPGSDFPAEDWKQPFGVWAARDYVSFDERPAGSQELASAVIRWEVAYTPLLDPDLVEVPNKRRIKYKDRIYNIRAAEMRPRSEGQAIVLTTEAKVG